MRIWRWLFPSRAFANMLLATLLPASLVGLAALLLILQSVGLVRYRIDPMWGDCCGECLVGPGYPPSYNLLAFGRRLHGTSWVPCPGVNVIAFAWHIAISQPSGWFLLVVLLVVSALGWYLALRFTRLSASIWPNLGQREA